MIDPTVHTTGVNWAAVGTISGIVSAVVGVIGKWINNRLGNQDQKIDAHGKVIADTRVSVARIEGYMARQNGNQGRTPNLLPDLPEPVVVPPQSEIVVDS